MSPDYKRSSKIQKASTATLTKLQAVWVYLAFKLQQPTSKIPGIFREDRQN